MELTQPTIPASLKPVLRQIKQTVRKVTEPSSRLENGSLRRHARLLAAFTLGMVGFDLILKASHFLGNAHYVYSITDLTGLAVLLATYFLSRSFHARLATVSVLLMFPIYVFSNYIDGTNLNLAAAIAYLIPSYILASILFSFWELIGYGVVINGLFVLLPIIFPSMMQGFASIGGMTAINLLSLGLAVMAVDHRDHLEREQRKILNQSYNYTLEGWARVLEYRDSKTKEHSTHSAGLAQALAEACGIRGEELDHFYRGALLHDIGKIAIPDRILHKPAPLDADEWVTMRTHPQKALEILSTAKFLGPAALSIPQYHHEWWDGSGYPQGLKGEEIPLPARIFAVIDVYDALTEDRPYRKAWSEEDSVRYIQEQSGKQFDPQVVEQFLKLSRLCKF